MRLVLFVLSIVTAGACASGPELPPTHYRQQLKDAINRDVATREQRDENSRILEENLDGAEMNGMSQPDVRAMLGKALNCEGRQLCDKAGFQGTDWYYEIGRMTDEDAVRQMPVLIVGFGPRGHVTRVWTLTTH